MFDFLKKHGKVTLPILFFLLISALITGYYGFSPVKSFSDNLSQCNGTLVYACPDGFNYDNTSGICISDVSCPGGGTYNQPLGACTYCPSGTYDSGLNTCTGVSGDSVCTGSYKLVSYNGGVICEASPVCPDNSSMYYDTASSGMKCESQPTIICKTDNTNILKGFCTKRCYDARTDYPRMTDLNSDIPSDINKTFTIDVKKGFSGWGLLRPYSDGCFLKGKFQLCVSGGGTTLTLSFTFPDGTVKTVSGPLQDKYWNSFSWSVNPNMIGLFVRQHGTNTATFHYDDLVYKPLDNDTVGGHYSFNETFSPMKNDPYDFYFVELQPGTLEVNPNPFCSEKIAMCYYDFVASHAWTEYGRVFFGGLASHNILQSQISMSTYYRNNTQEADFNTGDMFMSTAGHPERGGAYRMWYNYEGDNSTTSVSPVQGCPDGYTLNGSTCTTDPLCSTGTYDSAIGECVSNASPSCPSGYDYNNNANTCVADASCPGTGTLNSSTNKCETYLGENCPGTYNVQGNECVGNASCPSGTKLNVNTDKCEIIANSPLCPIGYTYNTTYKACVKAPTCPSGGTYNPDRDRCEIQTTNACPSGYTYDSSNNTCESNPQCPSGSSYNTTYNECLESSTSSCPSGYTENGSKCIASPLCPSGSSYNTSTNRCEKSASTSGTTEISESNVDGANYGIKISNGHIQYFNDNYGSGSWVSLNSSGTSEAKINDDGDYSGINLSNGLIHFFDTYESKTGSQVSLNGSGTSETCYYGYCIGISISNGYIQYIDNYYGNGDWISLNGSYTCPSGWSPTGSICYQSASCPSGGSLNVSDDKCESSPSHSCPSGFSYDSSLNKCVDSASCPGGGTLNTNTDKCEIQTTNACPSGYTYDSSNNTCYTSPVCNYGSYDSSINECRLSASDVCPSGYTYNSNDNTCQIDPTCDYGTFDASSDKCVVQATGSCETGYTQDNDTCVADPQCQSPGSYNSTLKECSAGITDNGCPSGSSYANGQCFSAPSCPGNGTWNSSDKECETGTTLTCPAGYTLSGDSCISSGGGSTAVPNLTEFGITQTNAQDNVTEEFGMYFPVKTLTAVNEGFIRKPSDFPSDEKQGYASNRHNDWLAFDTGALNYFFQDTGKNPGTCPSGQVTTDDGCFEDQADLCPSGQVELYPDYKGQCFQYIEHAACWNGQTQFGNQCYKKLSNTPNVCPSDGRSYTLLTPTTADYICKTTTQPSCPSGDIRDNNTCYKAITPSCPTGYTRQGGTCVETQPANCPSGTQNISGKCYYTSDPSCPSGYVLTGNRQCSKDEWMSGTVYDCYDKDNNLLNKDQWGTRLLCPDNYTKITNLGRWYVVSGQVGTCSSVSGTDYTAVGTHYYVCHSDSTAACPSGYEFNSNYQVTLTFTEIGHSDNYYSDNTTLALTGQYRWNYNESAPSCGSLYNHTSVYYDDHIYGGFVDSTEEYNNAAKICFNTSNRNCTVITDGCIKYDTNACPIGYSWDGTKCKRTISACPSGSYDSSADKCITYDRQACDITPYDWTYDSANDICVYKTDAQCNPGERKKADGAQWSACYQLDTAYGQPPGHIYCRNNLTYWDYGNKEGCYQKKRTACDGQYQSEPNPDVIIGSGNQYNEWTGKCWLKTKDLCDSGELYGRGEYQPSGVYHCLKKNFKYDYITPGQADADTLSKYMCDYILHGNLNVDSSEMCGKVNLDNATDVWYDFNNPHAPMDNKYRPICPIDKNERCTWLGGSLEVCGTNKKCAYCTKNVDKSADYADIKKIAYYNGEFFGLTYNTHTFDQAQQMAADMSASLPSSGQSGEVNAAFSMSVNCWYSDTSANSSVLYKPVVVIWGSLSDVGFFAPCDFDSNGDMICTADATECVNGQCPYGSQYTCQPYNGGEYCSRFSSQCANMGNPQNAIEEDNDTAEGSNDKKKDGNVTENGCEGNVYIFNGKDERCRLPGIKTGFANCCKKHKDWLGMGKCKPSEVLLQQKVDAGVCHEVGTYCAVKIFGGICLQKKKTYCCFNSVLGRIVQEQSREKQSLPAKDWGKPKDPICWGFKPAQFQALDWSLIDLSEYYSYIEKKVVPQATESAKKAINNASHKLQNQMQNMFSQ